MSPTQQFFGNVRNVFKKRLNVDFNDDLMYKLD